MVSLTPPCKPQPTSLALISNVEIVVCAASTADVENQLVRDSIKNTGTKLSFTLARVHVSHLLNWDDR